jgi:hypothetical protein
MIRREDRYTGVCAVQENCTDYADFIESIMDELGEDDDPVCPIKCAKRVNPQQDAITLTPALQDYYAMKSHRTGKPISVLVLSDLTALHRKRVVREEKRVWKENEYERL